MTEHLHPRPKEPALVTRLMVRGAAAIAKTMAWILALVGLWWAGIRLLRLDAFTAKTPADVWQYLFAEPTTAAARNEILDAAAITVGHATLGFLAGSLAACVLGAAVAISRTAEFAVMPLALVLRSVPLAAMAPLITLVLGQGLIAKTTVASVVVFFPSFVSAILGLRSLSPSTVDLFAANGATSATLFFKARVPSAVPAFLASVRIGLPGSLVGVLIAEWLVTGDGVGAYMINAQNSLDYTGLWAAATVITVAAVLMYFAATVAEESLRRWMHEGDNRFRGGRS